MDLESKNDPFIFTYVTQQQHTLNFLTFLHETRKIVPCWIQQTFLTVQTS